MANLDTTDRPDGEPPAGDPSDGPTPMTLEPSAEDEGSGTPQPGSAAGAGRRLPYFPALDGLRGVAVIAVLLFHSRFDWARGGYLGVSTFFTLSGFLITALLLAERGATASIGLRAFWTRRIRRLMPAAFAGVGLAILFAAVAGDPAQQRNLAGDGLAALLNVANWRFLLTDQSYADLFSQPSPLLHYWSLAIEEQFYLLYPLAAFALLVHYALRRRPFAAVLAVATAASVGLTLFAGFSHDHIYFGTFTRAAELLIGALLAAVVYDRRVTAHLAGNQTTRRILSLAGLVALLVVLVLMSTTSQLSDWLYEGGLPAYAVLSALVILAAVLPSGPVRRLLGIGPLVAVGTISYGVYVYHWPLFLWLDESRTGLSGAPLLVVRLTATFALAVVSYRFLERPIRHGERLGALRPSRLAPVAAAVLVIGLLTVTLRAPGPVIDFDAAAAQLQQVTADAPAPVAAQPLDQPPFPRMAMFGDSTAMMTSFGMNTWANETGRAQFVDGAAWLGCGVGRGGIRRTEVGEEVVPDHCNNWAVTWGQRLANSQPNIAVVQVGPWEVTDRKLEGDDSWRAPGDPVYDEWLLGEMVDAVDTLSQDGAVVVWLTSPNIIDGELDAGATRRGAAAAPARMAALNTLIRQLPEERPGKVEVVDLAGWLTSTGEDAHLRPDGVHFSASTSEEVCARWLCQAIVDAQRANWDRRHAATADLPDTTAAPTTSTPSEPTTSTTVAGGTRSVLVLGDVEAEGVADALRRWSDGSKAFDVQVVTSPCGIVAQAGREDGGQRVATPPECADATYGWLQAAVAVKPDVVLIVPSVWDVVDQQAPGDPNWRAPGDAAFDEAMLQQYQALADALHKAPTIVAWATSPPFTVTGPDGDALPAADPARVDALNAAVREARVGRDWFLLVDLATWADGASLDGPLLGDGRTIADSSRDSVGDWIGPELFTLYNEYLTTANIGG